MATQKEWFENWFDSPYHAMLYRHRDEHEAKLFIENLFDYLNPPSDSKVLDIACGDGRHAAIMSQFVDEVIGIDLSEKRIENALQLSKPKLAFYRHDMRNVFRLNYFDYAFNFFTSFGYFQNYKDNIIAAQSFANSLKPGGILVMDYMNVDVVINKLVSTETKLIDDVTFNISRKSENGKISKTISIQKNMKNQTMNFQEVVSEFRLSDFENIFENTGLELQQTFGDYQLNAFESQSSPRLIMLFKKH